jgi:hypothetical protein
LPEKVIVKELPALLISGKLYCQNSIAIFKNHFGELIVRDTVSNQNDFKGFEGAHKNWENSAE